jgi:hypothetical protein
MANATTTEPTEPAARRARLSQEDVPGSSLDQALKVAQAIADNYAFQPTRPLNVADAMGVRPTSGGFRGVTGAAVAYGLTTGAYNSSEIGLTPLGLRIVRPTTEGDDLSARREALLKPRVIGEFLRQYDGAALPSDTIARNVLQDKGVPADRTSEVLTLILASAEAAGLVKEINGRRYVDLSGASSTASASAPSEASGSPAPVIREAPVPQVSAPQVTVGSGVNINIEIHIAADASTQTIEDIFKNMRRYVLRPDGDAENAD